MHPIPALNEMAMAFVQTVEPLDFHKMKSWGLNRYNRRRLATLCRQNKLSTNDIPVWLLFRVKHEGTLNG